MTITEALDQQRVALAEAETDIADANATHRETMARLQEEANASEKAYRDVLNDAVTRKMKAQGAIEALEGLREAQL